MTVNDLIKYKNYDYMEWRITAPGKYAGMDNITDIFFGITRSENGKLISLDGDSYNDNTPIREYREWSSENIHNGITVII